MSVELGFAIAKLVPSLIQAGFVVSDTIKDIVNFDHDASKLEIRFDQCSRKLEATQHILLDADKIVSGRLLDQLSEESQRSIYWVLVELYLLFISFTQSEAKYRLERANIPPLPDLGPIEGKFLAASILGIDQPTGPTYTRKAPWYRRIGWGLSGKKKTFKVIGEYEEWLLRLRDELLQFWWPLPPTGSVQSMVALSKDADAKVVGISDNASTALLLQDPLPEDAKNVWLSRSQARLFKNFQKIEDSMAYGKWEDDTNVLVEYKADGQDNAGNIEQITTDRLAKVGLLLKKQNDERFRVLKLLGLGHQSLDQRIGFVYQFPKDAIEPPRSLLHLIPENQDTDRPPLGVRMELAYQLCQSMYLLHSVGWLHKGFRSEIIIFFPNTSAQVVETEEVHKIDTLVPPTMRMFTAPWIIGFEFSRKDNDFSSRRKEDVTSRNIYRHPKRWGLPSERHSKIHDIYALGVVLLEIGLWQRCSQLDESGLEFQNITDGSQVQKLLVEHTERRLGYTAGERYQRLTWQCLQGDAETGFGVSNDDKVDSNLMQAFRENVIHVLDEIRRCLQLPE